ncbi:hypothetical protein RR46_03925 [Papilio xuthus]|uniref:Uncharacterized protein n=1 Tax=Papilio xuthus TaxID=66420 RepID=A0A194Q831_PAPXU|nr:hypothetical protein RR46_03925 [Papilio xuthus]
MEYRVLQILVVISTLSRSYVLCYDKYWNDSLTNTSTRSLAATAELRSHVASEQNAPLPPPLLHIGEAPPLMLGQAPPAVLWHVPPVVYSRAVYEPVAHDHPSLASIRAFVAANRRRRRRGHARDSEYFSSADDSESSSDYD